MKLNQLIAQALNKPVEALTLEDVNAFLLKEVRCFNSEMLTWYNVQAYPHPEIYATKPEKGVFALVS